MQEADKPTGPAKPLTRERVLGAAVAYADRNGIEALSMRKLGQELGVEAMSLYNHVSNKDDLVDGVVERVAGEFALPAGEAEWKDALRETATSVRAALLRHPWAAALIQSRVTPSEARMRYADAVLGALRRAGFSLEEAYRAQLTLNSYVYGFALHEVSWPFEPDEQSAVATGLRARVEPAQYPHLTEMLGWIMTARAGGSSKEDVEAREADFRSGLDLILEALDGARTHRE